MTTGAGGCQPPSEAPTGPRPRRREYPQAVLQAADNPFPGDTLGADVRLTPAEVDLLFATP
jgi:hypothetical protein